LAPWRVETFTFSTDPELKAQIRDVVGLYLNPPEKAVVLCVDEKSQVQALDRTAPVLPLRPGTPEKPDPRLRPARHDHTVRRVGDRHRQSRRCLLPAPPPPRVSAVPQKGHANLPEAQAAHRPDNYAVQKHPTSKPGWPATPNHHTLHPTSAAWMNMVEIFFSIITRQAIRRGSYHSVADLHTAIHAFIGRNERCRPFTWTKTADEVLDYARPGQRTSFARQ